MVGGRGGGSGGDVLSGGEWKETIGDREVE